MKNPPPHWQIERASILTRACRSLKGATERGENLSRAGKRVARRYNGQAFKCDPSRKLRLRPSTLRRVFRVWTRNGEVPGVFHLNFIYGRQSVFTSPMLTRFLQFIIDRPQPSLAEAWKTFCARGGSFGPGRRNGRPLKPTYYQIRWALPTALFKKIAAQQKVIQGARAKIEQIQLEADAHIRTNYPERLPARRIRRFPDFQI